MTVNENSSFQYLQVLGPVLCFFALAVYLVYTNLSKVDCNTSLYKLFGTLNSHVVDGIHHKEGMTERAGDPKAEQKAQLLPIPFLCLWEGIKPMTSCADVNCAATGQQRLYC